MLFFAAPFVLVLVLSAAVLVLELTMQNESR
jgi:hypothetical protein